MAGWCSPPGPGPTSPAREDARRDAPVVKLCFLVYSCSVMLAICLAHGKGHGVLMVSPLNWILRCKFTLGGFGGGGSR